MDKDFVSSRAPLLNRTTAVADDSSIKDPSESARRTFRILMYCTYFPPEYSGAALQAISLAKALRKLGHHIEFITERWHDEPALEVHEGFTVHRISGGRRVRHAEFLLWFQLVRFCWKRRRDFDIIHSHGAYYRQAIIGPIARFLGMGSLVKASLANNDLKRSDSVAVTVLHGWLLRRVDAYVAISRQLALEFEEFGLSAKKIYDLPNGVDTNRFRPVTETQRQMLRRRLGLPEQRSVVLFVGVFDQRKNVDWLARTWVESQGSGCNALLVAIGPTSRDQSDIAIKSSLTALATMAPDWLRILDIQSNIEEYYQAADALVLPSIDEGMPNCVLEAMSCDIPCVLADSDWSLGFGEENNRLARFVSFDKESLVRMIKCTVAKDKCRFANINRNQFINQFSIDIIASKYHLLYERILGFQS